MSTAFFRVHEHVIPCQHIREYPDATLDDQEATLQLAVKKYTPLENDSYDLTGAVTIITANATGFPKEIYEPLFDDLLQASKLHGFKIRAIWAADCASQGTSGVLNEHKQGDDTNWFDHSRDLLLMVNHFRNEMHRPLVGLGHSLGAAQLAQLSHMHPRLFHTLVLMEPVIQREHPPGPNAAMLSTFRPDIWPSRATAEAALSRNRFFKSFDPRVLKAYLMYGLRETPTVVYPNLPAKNGEPPVTLTTTKHQEAWSYMRPNFSPTGVDWDHQRLVSPDMNPNEEGRFIFHRAELISSALNLPFVRPSVLWVCGKNSYLNPAPLREEKLRTTGTGRGGNGGVDKGRVKMVVLDSGHMVCCEKVQRCAEAAADWLGQELERWRREEEFYRKNKSGKSERDGLVVSKQWMKTVRLPAGQLRTGQEKL